VPAPKPAAPVDPNDSGHPKIVVLGDSLSAGYGLLELGANDGLRGLPIAEMKKNLAAIIQRAQEKRIAVLLAGMEAPPNFGPEYTVSFRQVYRDLSKEYKVTFLPFLLDKVAGDPSLNQGDGIHPNIQGSKIVADTVWNVLKPMVDAAAS